MTTPAKRTLTVAALSLAILGGGCLLISQSLLRSESNIRASLLKRTPIGSDAAEVRSCVQSSGWLDPRYIGSSGFLKQEPGRRNEIVGVSSICGQLGHYWLPFRTDVTAFWGFDNAGKLIDVWVWKTTDAL